MCRQHKHNHQTKASFDVHHLISKTFEQQTHTQTQTQPYRKHTYLTLHTPHTGLTAYFAHTCHNTRGAHFANMTSKCCDASVFLSPHDRALLFHCKEPFPMPPRWCAPPLAYCGRLGLLDRLLRSDVLDWQRTETSDSGKLMWKSNQAEAVDGGAVNLNFKLPRLCAPRGST